MKQIDCFDEAVLAVITDRSVDFKLLPEMDNINQTQKDYLQSQLGIDRVVNIRQVHGNRVVCVKDVSHPIEEADALITDAVRVPITVRTADCVPIFLYDKVNRAIGIVHAGWQSTKKQIASKTVEAMSKHFQTDPKNLTAYIGPCIRKSSFEVGPEFKDYFPNEYELINGRGYVDVAQANINQLTASGLLSDNIKDCQEDTFTTEQWFSFRRDKEEAGRMLHIMMIK